MTVETDIERAFVDSLLEERFAERGAVTDPAPARRERSWRALAAAVLLLGAAAVGAAWWLSQDDDPGRSAQERQDKNHEPQRPEISTNAWRPKSREELVRALGTVTRVRVRYTEVKGMPVKATDFPPGPLVTILASSRRLTTLCADVAKAAPAQPGLLGFHPAVVLHFELPGHKHIGATLQTVRRDGDSALLAVEGFGAFPVPERVVDELAKAAFVASAESKTIAALGLAHPKWLREVPADARYLRLFDFAREELARLARFGAATSVDLRYAPAVNDAAGLRALHAVLPRLETLRLHGDDLDAAAWAELVKFTELRDLQVMSRTGSYWGVPTKLEAAAVTDGVVPFVLRFKKLRSLVVPGSSLTDAGLAQLAELPDLGRLIVSGSPKLTGSGFAAFAQHGALAEVHANGCTGFTGAGLKALAQVPPLMQVFLRRVRRGDNVSAAGLAAFGTHPRLRRLELSHWFDIAADDPRRYASMQKDANGSVLSAAWQQALVLAAHAPKLEWLALDGCRDLVKQDLECLRGSSIDTLNLGGTVGKSPARISADALEWIFELPQKLETLITE